MGPRRAPTTKSAGWNDLKKHMWFAGYDWDGVYARQVKPPLKPLSRQMKPDEPCTLDATEAPDVPACPEWFPYLPKTLHNWRDAPQRPEPKG